MVTLQLAPVSQILPNASTCLNTWNRKKTQVKLPPHIPWIIGDCRFDLKKKPSFKAQMNWAKLLCLTRRLSPYLRKSGVLTRSSYGGGGAGLTRVTIICCGYRNFLHSLQCSKHKEKTDKLSWFSDISVWDSLKTKHYWWISST